MFSAAVGGFIYGDAAPSGPTVIGQSFGGGYYAGKISTTGNGVADFYLIVGPVASAQTYGLRWKTANNFGPASTSDIDGPGNSNSMNSATYPAAQYCKGLSVGGYSDWYMPAKNELEVCYYNLKPTTERNNGNAGNNPNAVPSHGNYDGTSIPAQNPAQTSATDFRSTGAEDFDAAPTNSGYWCSSMASSQYSARYQGFGNGYQGGVSKNTTNKFVRAVRRVPV